MVLTVSGLALLVVAADFSGQGGPPGVTIWRPSPLVIGLTVVSFGTSMPEMFQRDLRYPGQRRPAVANVLGSNIFNVLVVHRCGSDYLSAPVQNSTVLTEIPFSRYGSDPAGLPASAALGCQ